MMEVATRELVSAYRLARGHGHEWGQRLTEQDVRDVAAANGRDAAIAEIAALCEERRPGPEWAGISAPTPIVGGTGWQHTTGTGRVTWRIRGGGLRVEVHRPQGLAFAVEAPALPAGNPECPLHSIDVEPRAVPWRARHVEAAADCLAAAWERPDDPYFDDDRWRRRVHACMRDYLVDTLLGAYPYGMTVAELLGERGYDLGPLPLNVVQIPGEADVRDVLARAATPLGQEWRRRCWLMQNEWLRLGDGS